MATITMYLKYEKGDLYYSMDNVKFSPLEEDTVTGVNSGDTVIWKIADDSIKKINNIKVNETKSGQKNKNWKDIWEKKPKSNDGGQSFEGLIQSGLDDTPKFNGYTVKYKTADEDKEKDPDLRQPPGTDGDD